jgi:hypothetical protein
MKDNAEQTAIAFTLKGIESLIRNAERELAELDEFDAMFGDAGRNARDEGRQRSRHNLEVAREAYRIRKEAGGS